MELPKACLGLVMEGRQVNELLQEAVQVCSEWVAAVAWQLSLTRV